jgi:hypothetical protein
MVGGPPMKVEPSANVRVACGELFEMFTGLIDAGFTETQALYVVINIIQAGMAFGS